MPLANETTELIDRATLEARAGNLTQAHVLRAEAVYLGAKNQPAWSAEAAAITDAQSASLIEAFGSKGLRVASQAKAGDWAYRSVKQYQERPQGPILAVTNEHPNRLGADSAPRVGDDELRDFTHLPAFMALSLKYAQITDAGLGLLSAALHLRHLSLTACHQVTGPGIAQLKSLHQLSFELHPTQAPLEWLKQLPHLERLSLEGFSNATDDIFRIVSMMPNLRRLTFGRGFMLTDAHLRQLTTGSSLLGVDTPKKLPHLSVLDLSEARLEDAALLHLVSLPALAQLTLGHTKMSPTTQAKLAAAMPKLIID